MKLLKHEYYSSNYPSANLKRIQRKSMIIMLAWYLSAHLKHYIRFGAIENYNMVRLVLK